MSTRALIGIANKDNTIHYIYSHFDGYVKGGVGEILLNKFTTKQAVIKLLAGGSARSIDSAGTVSYFDDEGSDTVLNDEYTLGKAGSEYVYLFEPETKTWIYKHYENSTETEQKVSDWKLLSV